MMKECPECGAELEMRLDREKPEWECPNKDCPFWQYMTPQEIKKYVSK